MKSLLRHRDNLTSIVSRLVGLPNSLVSASSIPTGKRADSCAGLGREVPASVHEFLRVFGGTDIDMGFETSSLDLNWLFRCRITHLLWNMWIPLPAELHETILAMRVGIDSYIDTYGVEEEMKPTLLKVQRSVPIISCRNGDFILCDSSENQEEVFYLAFPEYVIVKLSDSIEHFLEQWSAFNYLGPAMLWDLSSDFLGPAGLIISSEVKHKFEELNLALVTGKTESA